MLYLHADRERYSEVQLTPRINSSIVMYLKKNLMLGFAGAFLLSGTASSFAAKAGLRFWPAMSPKLRPSRRPGAIVPTNELHLAIGLTLHDEQGLADLLDQIYDPASTNLDRYLSPQEFTQRFGSTEADYQP